MKIERTAVAVLDLKVPVERNRREVTLRKKDDVKIKWNVSFVKKYQERLEETLRGYKH